MPIDDPHGWVRDRMIAASLGLLDDDEQRRFREHVGTCEDCRRREHAFSDEPGEPATADGHVPPALLVAWSRHHAGLGAFERRAIEIHLARCEACREQLAMLRRRPIPIARTGRPMPGARGRRVAAWLAAATAAAATIVVVTIQLRPGARSAGPADRAVTPRPVSAELTPAGAPEILRTPMRGGAETGRNVVTPGPQGELVLGFEPMDQPGDVPVSLVVLGPEGRPVATVECRQRDLHTRHTLVLRPGERGFAAGRYTLAVVARPQGAAAETLALDFEVTHPH